MIVNIEHSDQLFDVSPDPGHPDCICSRCSEPIPEDECPIRVFVDEGAGGEYRYHIHCIGIVNPELRELAK